MATPPAKYKSLETKLDCLRRELAIPGLSVAIVDGQKIRFSAGLGLADLERQVPAAADTPYHIASLTKPFAAAVVMKLVEQDQLDLDAPMAEILKHAAFPSLSKNETIYGYRDACRRIRDLSKNPELPFASLLRSCRGDRELVTVRHHLTHTAHGKPGSEYAYNGFLFGMLTPVIEAASKRRFRDLLVEWITGPLGMTNTVPGFDAATEQEIIERRARYYRRTEDHSFMPSDWPPPEWAKAMERRGLETTPHIRASAGMISTVLDLAKFDVAMDRDAILSAPSKAAMYTPARPNSGARLPYGLGWFIQDFDGQQIVWHYGHANGAYSSLWLKVPVADATMILLTNSDGASDTFDLGEGDVLGSPFARLFLHWVTNGGEAPK